MDRNDLDGTPSSTYSLLQRFAETVFLHHAAKVSATADRVPALDLDDPQQRHFGEYELLELLVQGSGGWVYRARQAGLDREVVLKMHPAGPWASTEHIERFRTEAVLAAHLQHPDIVPIHAFGVLDGMPWFSMRLVEGPNLAVHLDEVGTLPPRQAAQLLRTLAHAVYFAHQHGILHRDLKPENILLDARGWPQITDFGLSCRFGAPGSVQACGTPGYMAPEQVDAPAETLTAAVDVHALGAVLYTMLSGHAPYVGKNFKQVLKQMQRGRVRGLRSRGQAVPRDLEAICLKCLEHAPDGRYANALLLAEDLERFLDGRPVHSRPLGLPMRIGLQVRREPQLALALLAILLVLSGGLLTSAWQWQRAEGQARQAWAANHRAQRVLVQNREALIWQAMRQRDDTALRAAVLAALVDAERRGDKPAMQRERLRLGLLKQYRPQLIDRLQNGEPISAIAVSPDASRVAVAGATRLRVHALDRNALLADFVVPTRLASLAYTPDGRWLRGRPAAPVPIAFDSGVGMVLFDASNGKVWRPPAGTRSQFDATFSDDGKYALLSFADGYTQVWDVTTRRPLGPKVFLGEHGIGKLIAPDAQTVAIARQRYELVEVRRVPDLALLARYPAEVGERYTAWAWHPQGRRLALGQSNGTVQQVSAGKRKLMQAFSTGQAPSVRLHYSAKGTWLVSADQHGWLRVWRSGSGILTAAPVQQANSILAPGNMVPFINLHLSPEHRLLAVSTRDGVDFWGLGPAKSFGLSWGLRAASNAEGVADSFIDLQHGLALLADTAARGGLQMWRMPASARLPWPAPPRHAAGQSLGDGRHLVEVAGTTVRVRDARNGRVLGSSLPLPAPVNDALIDKQARTLVLGYGRSIAVYDLPAGRPRYPPLALDAAPQRVALSEDGRWLAVSIGESRNVDGGVQFWERIAVYAMVDGRRLTTTVALRGPLRRLAFSPDGQQLYAWSFRDSVLHVWRSKDLSQAQPPLSHAIPLTTLLHGRKNATGQMSNALVAGLRRSWLSDVVYAAKAPWRLDLSFDRAAGEVHPFFGVVDSNAAVLSAWDRRDGRLRHRWILPCRYERVAVNARATRALLFGRACRSQLALFDLRSGRLLPLRTDLDALQILHGDRGSGRVAVWRDDGAVVAVAAERTVLLLDGRSGEPLAAPLDAGLPAYDSLIALTWSNDGKGLLGRSHGGVWTWWDVPSETRASTDLKGDQRILSTQGSSIAATRTALRSSDRGPMAWKRSMPPLALPPLVRSTVTSDMALDLSTYYTDMLRQQPDNWDRLGLATMPRGPLRYEGIDYDLRGTLYNADRKIRDGRLWRLPLAGRVAALHLLLTVSGRATAGIEFARIRLRYRDGGSAVQSLRFGEHAWSSWYSEFDNLTSTVKHQEHLVMTVPVSSRMDASTHRLPVHLYAVTIRNPEPHRRLHALEMLTPQRVRLHTLPGVLERSSAVVVYAISTEKP